MVYNVHVSVFSSWYKNLNMRATLSNEKHAYATNDVEFNNIGSKTIQLQVLIMTKKLNFHIIKHDSVLN